VPTLEECADVYGNLLHKYFILTLEDGTTITLIFNKSAFPHLLGLHKLADLPQIKNISAAMIYKNILYNRITNKDIGKSKHIDKIADRLKYFNSIPELLNSKIIIDYNDELVANSKLNKTKYILFKRTPPDGYIHLSLGSNGNKIYPETFFYEGSKRYINEQILLDIVDVQIIPIKRE